MIQRVWLLETSEGGNPEAFLYIDDAKDYAYKLLIDWGYDPISDHDKEVFQELEDSYKDKTHTGFWVDEVLWCYEVNYHY